MPLPITATITNTITSAALAASPSGAAAAAITAGTAGKSWTDDLPVCHATAIGSTNNQRYRSDGSRQEAHAANDYSFHCRIDEHTCIYGVFSGLGGGGNIANSALQRVAAEIVLGQLDDRSGADEVREVLRHAFVSVERGYAESIDTILAKKAMLQCELEGITQYEISRQYQEIVDQLNHINRQLAIGTSVVLALIHRGLLYICNIGSCRALLCKNDANGVLRVVQLSVEHNLQNEDEVLRLTQLGLDVETVAQTPCYTTRCIGAYAAKAGYRDCTYLSAATAEPITSEPEIVGAIPLDDSCRFLLLMSSGLCRSLYDIVADPTAGVDDLAGDTVATNKEIVQLAVEEFRMQSTLSGVAQASVNRVVQLHHDSYMRRLDEPDEGMQMMEHDDVTLLVRNFNFPMPNAIQRRSTAGSVAALANATAAATAAGGSSAGGGAFVNAGGTVRTHQGTLLAAESMAAAMAVVASSEASATGSGAAAAASLATTGATVPDYFHTNTDDGGSNTDTNSSTNSLAFRMERDRKFDKNYRIQPYVDFGEFNRQFEEAKKTGMLPEHWKHIIT